CRGCARGDSEGGEVTARRSHTVGPHQRLFVLMPEHTGHPPPPPSPPSAEAPGVQ
uniref:Uncharacterized protein n=2 Tax=Ixodes scapularis TaxID=6945 RepID=A0A1S4LCM3_IXOSC